MNSGSLQMSDYLFKCSSQSSGGGGLSATVRANRTCRSHSFITLRALWLSYRGTGVGVTISTSITESESLQTKKKYIVTSRQKNSFMIKLIIGRIHFTRVRNSRRLMTIPNCSLISSVVKLHLMIRSFLTHDKASGWRRGVTNSVLVGRALLASG